MDGLVGVRRRFAALEKVLDERSRRLLVAAECSVWGPGGISAVSQATGISRPVIRQGLKELEQPAAHPDGRIRRPGGGRKKAKQKDPTLIVDLEKLVDSTTRGDPERCLRWTCRSVRKLAEELGQIDRKSTRLNSSHLVISYAVFCLKKTKHTIFHRNCPRAPPHADTCPRPASSDFFFNDTAPPEIYPLSLHDALPI